MQQAPGGTSGAYCPFCGAPVGVAGARFCAVCGRDMLTGTPNAGQASPPVYASQPPVYGAAVAPPYGPVVYAPQPGGMGAMTRRFKVSAARMIWVGVGLLTLMVILLNFQFSRYLIIRPFIGFSYFSYFRSYIRSYIYFLDGILMLIGYAAVTAYLYGARRLASASWGRALAEVAGGAAMLAAIVLVLAGFFYGFSLSGVILVFLWLFLELAVAALLGMMFAGWSAPWKDVRARLSPFQDGHVRFAIIALIIAAALAYGSLLLFIAPNFFLMLCLIVLLPAVIIGAALAAGRLNRLLAQSAAPSWSPSPTPPGAVPAWAPPVAPTPIPPSTPPITPSGGIDPDR